MEWSFVVSCLLVLSSDGNARSGVFMALWNALDRLKTEQEVDVFHTVQLLRMSRPQFIVNSVSIGCSFQYQPCKD